MLRRNPSAQVETIKTFKGKITTDLIELRVVGNAGMLMRISLAVNGAEAHFHIISESDNQ